MVKVISNRVRQITKELPVARQHDLEFLDDKIKRIWEETVQSSLFY
jgi:hypothetical protein